MAKLPLMASLPPRERGLKLIILPVVSQRGNVAPPAGAWIETSLELKRKFGSESLPPRERGLKLYSKFKTAVGYQSLPPRERGLKHRG